MRALRDASYDRVALFEAEAHRDELRVRLHDATNFLYRGDEAERPVVSGVSACWSFCRQIADCPLIPGGYAILAQARVNTGDFAICLQNLQQRQTCATRAAVDGRGGHASQPSHL